jgi:predicted DNA-binding protein
MEGKSVTIGIRVPEELRDVLATLAKADNRTVSQYCMLVLREHAEQESKGMRRASTK